MVKIVFCLRRHPGVSREEFQDYWKRHHSALVEARAATLGIRRYVQVHTLDVPVNGALRAPRGGPEPFDGVAELWWDSVDAVATATDSPEGLRAVRDLLDDEARFIDFTRSPIWVGQEVEFVSLDARPG